MTAVRLAASSTGKSRRVTWPRLGAAGSTALTVLAVVVALAVFAPLIAPQDPDQGTLLDAFARPGAGHWLGTDATGRDIASRLIYGARTSLLGPAAIVVVSLALSIPLGLIAAWRGGAAAWVISRGLDVVFAIPGLLLAILVAALFGPGLTAAVIALGVAYVPYVARLVVTAAEHERRLPYVQALSVQGLGVLRITTVHMLRNLAPVIAGQATVAFAYSLIDLAGLSFLGLGVQPPLADWGAMVSDRDAVLQGYPGQVIAASVAIVATALSLFILGSRLSGEQPRFSRRRLRNQEAKAQ
ncbi:MAG: transporter permease [Amycolatopsis sp.]|uniref:ABC transporter permease n=1 Tax=Amycolatopsis sp. TaxID=37632 RepID=UPI002622C710|nr:ABC transporter permease [Amycolatopsis sp.]MCU1680625.1 transporter permease [Amycolatopsis sp.]